jgi:chemotaxis protein methyltransferase CheR
MLSGKISMAPAFGSSAFPAAADIDDSELADIGTILGTRRNFCLSVYKSACMKRRIAIRMRATRCSNPAEYCRLLRQSEQELDLLQKVLTIHVSQFFRNPTLFEKLRAEVVPALFAAAHAHADKSLRIWCLGCASGEEPYSLAIMLREHFGRELRKVTTTIVGTDIDRGTLDEAHTAVYDEDRLKGIPVELRERFFLPHEGRQRLAHDIREMVTFFRADISSVEEYIRSNLVFCRNTLIYFTRQEQERILNGIADILPLGGILVLGKSETLIGATRRRFSPVSQTERIYRKTA